MSNALVRVRDHDFAAPVAISFDYTALSTEAAALARTTAVEMRADLGRHVESGIAVGLKLNRLKKVVEHGQFLLWLKAESPISERTAQRFMRLAEVYGPKSAIVADLPVTVLDALASPTVPDATRTEIIGRREAGERVDEQEIKSVVAAAKQEARAAARVAKEEARLSPAAKARRKARRQKEATERERRQVEREAQQARQEQATRELARLLVERLGDRLDDFLRLWEEANRFGLLDAIQEVRS